MAERCQTCQAHRLVGGQARRCTGWEEGAAGALDWCGPTQSGTRSAGRLPAKRRCVGLPQVTGCAGPQAGLTEARVRKERRARLPGWMGG